VQAFHILFALSRTELHAYAIKSVVMNDSLGSVNLTDSRIRKLLEQLQNEGFIEIAASKPAGKSGIPRLHYRISEHGTLRLKEELTRINHTVKIAKATSLMENETPIDIQRLLLTQKLANLPE